MRVLVIGGGGREHALVWKLRQSPRVSRVYVAPGNGGMAEEAECLPFPTTAVDELVHFAEEKEIDLIVVGPEAPLLAGLVDRFEERGLKVFGPRRNAARIEGSKRFAKELMARHGIPTARFRAFTDAEEARRYIREQGAPIVVKADGLAAGKGVVVARTVEEAEESVRQAMEERVFGAAGEEVVIEEYLCGQEMSLMAFVDGETVRPMEPAQDHKAVYDGDRGPNTGGMGAYSPVPQISRQVVRRAVDEILKSTARALASEGILYRGVLYAGLMITPEGPKVIEFNARFGDPEAQVILPRLKSDLAEILLATAEGRLEEAEIRWNEKSAVCVVMASEGYPGSYRTGLPIGGLPEPAEDRIVFHAGTRREGERIVTVGGRVLGVTALGSDLAEARDKAYGLAEAISFKGAHYRRDIADRVLKR